VGGLSVATLGSLVTEFTGVAAVGDLYGVPRSVTPTRAACALFAVVLSGSYRRTEKIALILGLFELAFFVVAWGVGTEMRFWNCGYLERNRTLASIIRSVSRCFSDRLL
jgi:Mn2+/Fe2+ NRAMP family transporter